MTNAQPVISGIVSLSKTECAQMKSLLRFLIGMIFVSTVSTSIAQTQSHTLPQDVVFVSREKLSSDDEYPGVFRTSLLRLDARTLEVTPFFFGDNAAYWTQPRGWAPNGALLAVLRYENYTGSFGTVQPQLCIFTREGELLSCAADLMPHWAPGFGLYTITWSENSHYVYFLSDSYTTSTQGARRIVEVDVTTGETQRVVFDIPFEHGAPVISWSSDFNTVVMGAGRQMHYQDPKRIINLTTETEIDPNSLIPNDMRLDAICPKFSPSDTYMAILANPEDTWGTGLYEAALYVLDADGNYVFVMDQDSGHGQVDSVGCPMWQADEEAIFFVASTEHAKRKQPMGSPSPRIFKYDLNSKQLTVHIEHDLLDVLGGGSLSLSANGDYLVLSAPYYTMEGTTWHTTWQIVVIFPDGNVLEIKSPDGVDWWHPIWVPEDF